MEKKKTGIFILLGLIIVIVLSTLISNLTTKEEIELLNVITYSEYKNLYKKDKLEFVYVGRPGCGACQITKPLLEEVQEEENIVWNYLNTDTMTQNDYNDIGNTAEVFVGEWGTPTLLSIKDGEVLNAISGYRDKEVLRKFVQDSKDGKKFIEETE